MLQRRAAVRSFRVLSVAVLAIAIPLGTRGSATPEQSAQPQAPAVFRAAAELVEVIVRVTDAQGRFVPNLTQDDFLLSEEGRPQTIVAFNRVDVPRAPVAEPEAARPVLSAPVTSTVATNADGAEARAFVLLLDDVLTSPGVTLPARRAAREFVERFVGPSDLIAAFSTGGRGVQTQEFTTDKIRILSVVDRFMGTRCRSQAASTFGGTNPLSGGGPASPRDRAFRTESEPEQVYDVRVVTDVIKALAEHLSGVRGRRVSLVWVSEGVDYNVQNVAISGANTAAGPDPTAVMRAMQEAIDALQRANVTLYAVDPRKLYSAEQLLPENLPEGMQPESTMNPLCRGANSQELMRSIETLRTFSEKTGGFAATNRNEFAGTFDRILDESSQYYVLGYQPTARGRDGEFKRFQVRVKPPGLQVSGRTGYVVSSPRPPVAGPLGVSPALAAALTSSLPTAGLPLRVQVIPRRGAEGRGLVYVVVEVAGKELQFTEASGRFTGRIEFGLLTVNRLAQQSNVTPVAMDLSLTPAQVRQIRQTGVRWLTAVDLAPGHYSLRVAGQAIDTKKTGATFLDIDVPKFEDDDLRVDGVALTSLPAALTITTGTSPVALGLSGPPTTARTFVVGDVITISADTSTPRDFTQGTLELTVKPQAAGAAGPVLLQRTVELADRAAAGQPRAWTVDTKTLGAGQFVLRLSIRDARGHAADTAVLFDVVAR